MDFTPTVIRDKHDRLMNELKKVIVGQDEFLEHLVIALFTGGHVLIEGVPGIGKTMSAKTLARTFKADFARIQFTPDLLPSDVTGTKVFDVKNSAFYFKKGPVFYKYTAC